MLANNSKLSNIPEETSSELRTVRSCPKCGSVKKVRSTDNATVSPIPSVTTSEAVLTQIPMDLMLLEDEEVYPDVRTNSEGLLTIVTSPDGIPTLLKMVGGILEASEASDVASTPTKGGFYQLGSDPTVPPNTSSSYVVTTPSEASEGAPEASEEAPEVSSHPSDLMCVCFNCWKAAGGKTWKSPTGPATPTVSPLPTNHITDIVPQTPTESSSSLASEDTDSELGSITTWVSEMETEESLLREKLRIQGEVIAKLVRISDISKRIEEIRRRDGDDKDEDA